MHSRNINRESSLFFYKEWKEKILHGCNFLFCIENLAMQRFLHQNWLEILLNRHFWKSDSNTTVQLTMPSVLAKSFRFKLTKTSVFSSPMAISTSLPKTSLTFTLISLTLSDLKLKEACFTLAFMSSKSLAMVWFTTYKG